MTHGSINTRALHPRDPCGTPAHVCPLLPLVSLSTKPANHLKWQFWSCNSPAENPPSAFHCSGDTERTSHLHKDVSHSIRSSRYLDSPFFTEPPSDYSSKSLHGESLTLILSSRLTLPHHTLPSRASWPREAHKASTMYGSHMRLSGHPPAPVAHELQKARQSIPFVHHSSPQMYS